MSHKGKKSRKTVNVQVVVRSRPRSHQEIRSNSRDALSFTSKEIRVKTTHQGKAATKSYHFDSVFAPGSTQDEVYKASVRPIILEVLAGFNCTVFAYGQTGTGKTYTMEGNPESSQHKGMIPRAVEEIFRTLEKKSKEFTVKVSFLEIYNEELIDLCADDSTEKKPLRIFEDTHGNRGMMVSNLEEFIVPNTGAVLDVLHKALKNRRVAETKLNERSSRSHCVFTITTHAKEANIDGEDVIRTGKLHLVDLAGAESVGRSFARGQRAKEAGRINQSLLTLGRVINALVANDYVPYRDSKLTRLLQQSLGGKSKTLIIATVSPSQLCVNETISTLDYAHKAKNILNKPTVNQKMSEKIYIRELTAQIAELKRQLEFSRKRNGIHLPPETYERLMKESSNMETTIANRDADFKVLEKKLKSTEESLTSTQTDLAKTQENLAQEKYVTVALRTNEEALLRGVNQLTMSVEQLSYDSELMQSKTAKMHTLEDKNQTSVKSTAASVRSKVASLKTRAESLASQEKNDSKMINGVSDDCLKASTQQLSNLKSHLNTSLKSLSEISNESTISRANLSQSLSATIQLHANHSADARAAYADKLKLANSTLTQETKSLCGVLGLVCENMASEAEKIREFTGKATEAVADLKAGVEEVTGKVRKDVKENQERVLEGVGAVEGEVSRVVGEGYEGLSRKENQGEEATRAFGVASLKERKDFLAETEKDSGRLAQDESKSLDAFASSVDESLSKHKDSVETKVEKLVGEVEGMCERYGELDSKELRNALQAHEEAAIAREERLIKMIRKNEEERKRLESKHKSEVMACVTTQHEALLNQIQELLKTHMDAINSQHNMHFESQVKSMADERAVLEAELTELRNDRKSFTLQTARDAENRREKACSAILTTVNTHKTQEAERVALLFNTVNISTADFVSSSRNRTASHISHSKTRHQAFATTASKTYQDFSRAHSALSSQRLELSRSTKTNVESLLSEYSKKVANEQKSHSATLLSGMDGLDSSLDAFQSESSKLHRQRESNHKMWVAEETARLEETSESIEAMVSNRIAEADELSAMASAERAAGCKSLKSCESARETYDKTEAKLEVRRGESIKQLKANISEGSKALGENVQEMSKNISGIIEKICTRMQSHEDAAGNELDGLGVVIDGLEDGYEVYEKTCETPRKREVQVPSVGKCEENEKLKSLFGSQSPKTRRNLMENPFCLKSSSCEIKGENTMPETDEVEPRHSRKNHSSDLLKTTGAGARHVRTGSLRRPTSVPFSDATNF